VGRRLAPSISRNPFIKKYFPYFLAVRKEATMFNKTSRPEAQELETTEDARQADSCQLEDQVEAEAIEQGEASATEGEADSWQGKYQLLQEQFTRLAADFDNYRKRTREEQESLAKYGVQKSITELLPALDNLERATGSLTEDSDPKALYKSFGVMQKQLMDALGNMGVKKIPAVSQPFDPQWHEAVNQMESAEFPEDTIMYEAQSGYQLHDKVIRPAMVVVSTGSPEKSEAEAAGKPHNPFVK